MAWQRQIQRGNGGLADRVQGHASTRLLALKMRIETGCGAAPIRGRSARHENGRPSSRIQQSNPASGTAGENPPPPGVTPPGVPWGECNPELRSAPTLFESAHVERYTRCSKQCRGEHSPPRVSTRSAALTTPLDRACGTAHRGARRSARQSTAASAENSASQCPVEHSVHAP